MNNRIHDKIEEIEKYLAELEEIKPDIFEEYAKDIKTKAACERNTEKIIKAIADLTYLVIKDRGLGIPESDTDAFNILLENKIISAKLASSLQGAKGMRNIIAHEYGEIDDQIIFNSISEELCTDSREFLHIISKVQ